MSRICSICNEPIIPVQDHPTGWRHSDAADVSIFGNKPCCGWAKPKSEQPTQLPKRPHTLDVERAENWLATNHPYFSSSRQLAEVLHDYSLATCQDAKIAELEKELRVMRRALEMACSGSVKIMPDVVDRWIESARKESNDGE